MSVPVSRTGRQIKKALFFLSYPASDILSRKWKLKSTKSEVLSCQVNSAGGLDIEGQPRECGWNPLAVPSFSIGQISG